MAKLLQKQKLVRSIASVSYQRNGISGQGYHLIHFTTTDGVSLVGVVFAGDKHCAVFDPKRTDSSQFRGDDFEPELRAAIE